MSKRTWALLIIAMGTILISRCGGATPTVEDADLVSKAAVNVEKPGVSESPDKPPDSDQIPETTEVEPADVTETSSPPVEGTAIPLAAEDESFSRSDGWTIIVDEDSKSAYLAFDPDRRESPDAEEALTRIAEWDKDDWDAVWERMSCPCPWPQPEIGPGLDGSPGISMRLDTPRGVNMPSAQYATDYVNSIESVLLQCDDGDCPWAPPDPESDPPPHPIPVTCPWTCLVTPMPGPREEVEPTPTSE